MKQRLVLVVIMVLGAMLPVWGGYAAAQTPGVSETRFARLARGVNLPGWFWYGPTDPAKLESHFTEADFATIKALGFSYVRVPITLDFVMDPDAEDRLDRDGLRFIDLSIDRAFAADLAIMLDLHTTGLSTENFSQGLDDPAFRAEYLRFWGNFAGYLSARDPERLFFEPMNEPLFEERPADWEPIQVQIVAAIRAAAPEHTIVATGPVWSNLDQFVLLEPLDDPNVVYNFHFYEPFVFTHQGAGWSWWAVEPMRLVPYPSSPAAMAQAISMVDDAEIQGYLLGYGMERWDAEKIAARIGLAADWAQRNGDLRVICNEFGTYKPFAPTADRVQWHHDVVAAMEQRGIGWALWEYDQGFGIVERRGSRTIVDVALAEALGLTPAQ